MKLHVAFCRFPKGLVLTLLAIVLLAGCGPRPAATEVSSSRRLSPRQRGDGASPVGADASGSPRLNTVLHLTRTSERRAALAQWAGSLDQDGCKVALASEVAAIANAGDRAAAWGFVWARWVVINPSVAWQEALTASPAPTGLEDPLGLVFAAWREADPTAALRASEVLPPIVRYRAVQSDLVRRASLEIQGVPESDQLGSALWQLAGRDPASAWSLVAGLPVGNSYRGNVFSTVFSTWSGNDPPAAFKTALALKSVSDRRAAVSVFIQTMASKDLPLAIEYLRRIPRELLNTNEGRFGMGVFDPKALEAVLVPLAKVNPAQAKEVAALLHPSYNATAAGLIARGWGQADPVAAMRWAMTLRGHEDAGAYSAASVAGLEIINVCPTEKLPAVAGIVESLPPSAQRIGFTNRLVARWAKVDETAAHNWQARVARDYATIVDIAVKPLMGLILTDAKAATEQAIRIESANVRAMVFEGMASALAKKDLPSALSWAHRLIDKRMEAKVLHIIGDTLAETNPAAAAKEMVDAVLANEYFEPEDAVQSLINCLSANPAVAWNEFQRLLPKLRFTSDAVGKSFAEWGWLAPLAAVDAAATLPASWHSDAYSGVTMNFANQNTFDKVANWLKAWPVSGSAAEYFYYSFAREWLKADQRNALVWIGTLPQGSFRVVTIEALVKNKRASDPEEALHWAGTVEDEKVRRDLQEMVFETWEARDAQAAAAARTRLNLPKTIPGDFPKGIPPVSEKAATSPTANKETPP